MARSRVARHAWETLSDDQLLSLRFCDLELSIAGTELEQAIARLYRELDTRGTGFGPIAGWRRNGFRRMAYRGSRSRSTWPIAV